MNYTRCYKNSKWYRVFLKKSWMKETSLWGKRRLTIWKMTSIDRMSKIKSELKILEVAQAASANLYSTNMRRWIYNDWTQFCKMKIIMTNLELPLQEPFTTLTSIHRTGPKDWAIQRIETNKEWMKIRNNSSRLKSQNIRKSRNNLKISIKLIESLVTGNYRII